MPGSLTSVFLWSRCLGKRSRHSRRMHNLLFCVFGKRPNGGGNATCDYGSLCWRISFLLICSRGLGFVNILSCFAMLLIISSIVFIPSYRLFITWAISTWFGSKDVLLLLAGGVFYPWESLSFVIFLHEHLRVLLFTTCGVTSPCHLLSETFCHRRLWGIVICTKVCPCLWFCEYNIAGSIICNHLRFR